MHAVCGENPVLTEKKEPLEREQADSARWTHWCTAVQRERGGLWKHHEFSYSSDAVQERSARTSTALTYKPALIQQDKNPATTRTQLPRAAFYMSSFSDQWLLFQRFREETVIINPLLEFPQGEIEHEHMRSCVRARDRSHSPARAAIMRHSHWWRAPVSSY